MAKGDSKFNQYLDVLANGKRANLPSDTCCETRSETLIRESAERVMDIEDEIAQMKNNPDVVDIVATYADLQAYDTSKLTDKDIIRVLTDETHSGDSTYYRFSKQNNTFTYIGESKQYSDFTGTDGTSAGTSGLVPGPATTDAGKFLKADGTWGVAGGGITILTDDDVNYTIDDNDFIALWMLDSGIYKLAEDATVEMLAYVDGEGAPGESYGAGTAPLALVASSDDPTTIHDITVESSTGGVYYAVEGSGELQEITHSYWAFSGTDGVDAGTAGLVPAPETTDVDKFLKSDGTWDTAGGGGNPYNVYSTKTTSNSGRGGAIYLGNLNASQVQYEDPTTTDYHYRYFWALPYDRTIKPADKSIVIGAEVLSSTYVSYIALAFNGTVEANHVVNINGYYCGGEGTVVIGTGSSWRDPAGVAIGYQAGNASAASASGAVSLGAYSRATRTGEVNIGSSNSSYGFNSTKYRVIGGVHDGQDLHDVATVAQGNTLATSAPTTSTAGALGQLYTDTTNMHTYQLTAIDTTDPSNPSYTWTQRW